MDPNYAATSETTKPVSIGWFIITLIFGFMLGWTTNKTKSNVPHEYEVGLVEATIGSSIDHSHYGQAGEELLKNFKPNAVKLSGPLNAPKWGLVSSLRLESQVGDGKNGKGAVVMCIKFGKCCNYPEIMGACVQALQEARPLNKVNLQKHYCPMRPYMKYPDWVDWCIYLMRIGATLILEHATNIIPVVAEIKGIIRIIKGTVEMLSGFDILLPVKGFFDCLTTTELSKRMDGMLLRTTLGLLVNDEDKIPRPGDLINYYYVLGLAQMKDTEKGIPGVAMSFACRTVYALRFGFLPGVFKQIQRNKVMKWVFDTSNLGNLIKMMMEGITKLLGPLGTVFQNVQNEASKQVTGGLLGDVSKSGPTSDFAKSGLAMYFKWMRQRINDLMQALTGNQKKFQELGKIFVHDAELGWQDVSDYFIEDVIAPLLFNGIFWYCDKQRDPKLMGNEPVPKFFDKEGVPIYFKEAVAKEMKEKKCEGKEKTTRGRCYIQSCKKERGPTRCFKKRCVCAEGFWTQDREKCIPCDSGGPGGQAGSLYPTRDNAMGMDSQDNRIDSSSTRRNLQQQRQLIQQPRGQVIQASQGRFQQNSNPLNTRVQGGGRNRFSEKDSERRQLEDESVVKEEFNHKEHKEEQLADESIKATEGKTQQFMDFSDFKPKLSPEKWRDFTWEETVAQIEKEVDDYYAAKEGKGKQ